MLKRAIGLGHLLNKFVEKKKDVRSYVRADCAYMEGLGVDGEPIGELVYPGSKGQYVSTKQFRAIHYVHLMDFKTA